jgi:hypothetical protein
MDGMEGKGRGRGTYTLIPTRIRKGNQVPKRIQRLYLFHLFFRHRNHSSTLRRWFRYLRRRCCRRSGRRRGFLRVQRADLEFRFVFLEDGLVVVFPELLRGVFSGDAGEDLLAACASFHRQLLRPRTIGVKSGGEINTWMLILEGRQIIDILIDDDV